MRLRVDDIARHPAVLALLWAGSVALVAAYVDHFWIPLDDGTLAQSAERVLAGELPHRDFGDPYTGLNAVVGALAFRFFGVSLAVLRIPLVVGYALWLPAVWLLCRRFADRGVSIACALLVAVTSVLAYPAAMPTWFGLFAVTWGLAFLVRALDRGDRRWLLAAGAAAGVSILFKITGVYFLAAALLTVAWRRTGGSGYAATCGVALLVFLGALARLVLPDARPSTLVHFFLPGLAVCVALAIRVRPRRLPSSESLRDLAADAGALLLGTAAPVAVFLIPYVLSGSVGAWLEGVVILPTRRLGSASSPPGLVSTVVPGIGAVGLAWLSNRLGESYRDLLGWILAGSLILALAFDDLLQGAVFSTLWYSVRAWIPPLTIWGALVALRTEDGAIFAVVSTTALWALVQFPYTAPAYLFYVAPLGILATLAVVHGLGPGARPVFSMVAVLWMFMGGGYTAGVIRSGDTLLSGPRGGIEVSTTDAFTYELLSASVAARMGEGRLWVTPDAPEVYFLTGHPNPTRTLYEFLEPEVSAPDLATVDVVVLNLRPLFSAPPDAALRRRLADAGFQAARALGPFEMWARRDTTQGGS